MPEPREHLQLFLKSLIRDCEIAADPKNPGVLVAIDDTGAVIGAFTVGLWSETDLEVDPADNPT